MHPNFSFAAIGNSLRMTGWGCLLFLAVASPRAMADTILHDLTRQTGSAKWTSGAGAIEFGKPASDGNGYVGPGGTDLPQAIAMQPDRASNQPVHFAQGIFANLEIPTTATLVRIEADVQLRAGESTEGLTFRLLIRYGEEFYELSAFKATHNGQKATLVADLTAYRDQYITLMLRIDSPTPDGDALAIWHSVRIVDYGATLYDFISKADSAAWTNGAGQSVAFGAAPEEYGGARRISMAHDMNAEPHWNALVTVPNQAGTQRSMQGTFSGIAIPKDYSRVKFRAQVSTSTATGTTYAIAIHDGATTKVLTALTNQRGGLIDTFTADLTPYIGRTVDLILIMKPGPAGKSALGHWIEAKVIGYEPVTVRAIANPVRKIASTELSHNTASTTLRHIAISDNLSDVRLTAIVGLADDATTRPDANKYSLQLVRHGAPTPVDLSVEPLGNNLARLSANLTGYQGQDIDIIFGMKQPDPDTAPSPSNPIPWRDLRITGELPTQLFVENLGALPSDTKDDRPAIVSAFEKAKSMAPCEIQFAPGEYRLSTKITVMDTTGINVKGSPLAPTTLMMGDRRAGVIMLFGCRNFAFRNLTIDYSDLPYTQGTVRELGVGGPNKYLLEIDPGYPPLDGSFFDYEKDRGFGVFHEAASPYRPPDDVSFHNGLAAPPEFVAPGKFRLTVSETHGVVNGMKYVYHPAGWEQTFRALNPTGARLPGSQVVFDNITLYASRGCFAAGGIDKLFVRNCTVKLKPGSDRVITNVGDMVHNNNCVEGPDVINCYAENQDDDGVNIYLRGLTIFEADAARTRLSVLAAYNPLSVSDRLTFFRPSDGSLGDTVRVATVHGLKQVGTEEKKWAIDITIDQPLTASHLELGSDCLFNESYGNANYLIAGNTFRNIRGRGVVLKAGDGGIVRDNLFDRVSSRAIEASNDIYWNEGPGTRDLLIEGNTIDHCGYHWTFNRSSYSGVIAISGERKDYTPTAGILNRHITIRNNTITNWPRHALFVSSSDDVAITSNTLINYSDGFKGDAGSRGVMFFNNARNIKVHENKVIDHRPEAMMTGLLQIMRGGMTAEDLTAQGNTYDLPNDNPPDFTDYEITVVDSY